jgi:hypothetical protein
VQGVHVIQPLGVSTSTRAPDLLQDEPADATGYLLRPLLFCEQNNHRHAAPYPGEAAARLRQWRVKERG